ncbi:hypothetical protein ACFVJ8_24430 [Streptomyces yangpuensis]|uniref:hypothetical protein n=1 Tax=Streptomyces yangpuensis TaxID=1648182 RepID=UPI00363E30C0
MPLAAYATETAPNTFPRLPVRTGENVAVVLTSHPDEKAHLRHLTALRSHPVARDEVLLGIEREGTPAP